MEVTVKIQNIEEVKYQKVTPPNSAANGRSCSPQNTAMMRKPLPGLPKSKF